MSIMCEMKAKDPLATTLLSIVVLDDAATGARIAGAPKVLGRYLGLSLLAAAGVSLGLALPAEEAPPPRFGGIIINATLASVIISELVAPPLVEKDRRKSRRGLPAGRQIIEKQGSASVECAP